MSRRLPTGARTEISIGRLHSKQIAAYNALRGHRFMALRCGRRFGKTELAKTWIVDGLVKGMACAWIAPQHMLAQEVYYELATKFSALIEESAKAALTRARAMPLPGARSRTWPAAS